MTKWIGKSLLNFFLNKKDIIQKGMNKVRQMSKKKKFVADGVF